MRLIVEINVWVRHHLSVLLLTSNPAAVRSASFSLKTMKQLQQTPLKQTGHISSDPSVQVNVVSTVKVSCSYRCNHTDEMMLHACRLMISYQIRQVLLGFFAFQLLSIPCNKDSPTAPTQHLNWFWGCFRSLEQHTIFHCLVFREMLIIGLQTFPC